MTGGIWTVSWLRMRFPIITAQTSSCTLVVGESGFSIHLVHKDEVLPSAKTTDSVLMDTR